MALRSDEIYALSVFGDDGDGGDGDSSGGAPPFVSAAAVASRPDVRALPGGDLADSLIHVVFGASKDFCASGLRLGCLHTRNAALSEALVNLSYFALPSSAVQWAFARLFGDGDWLGGYVEENARRLRRSYAALTGALEAAGAVAAGAEGQGEGAGDGAAAGGDGAAAAVSAAAGPSHPMHRRIRYTPARAAMFLWVDLRRGLREQTWEEEESLWRHMVDRKRLLLTPGQACHAARPGFFRICW